MKGRETENLREGKGSAKEERREAECVVMAAVLSMDVIDAGGGRPQGGRCGAAELARVSRGHYHVG